MKHLVLSLTVLVCLIATGAYGQQEPKVLLFLWESEGWGKPVGPNPYGLRIALYDDGRLIFSEDTIAAMRGGTAPAFKLATLTPGAASVMAESVRAKLEGVPTEIRSESGITDQGWTIIQVWNAAEKAFRRYNAYGHPCLAKGRTFPDVSPPQSGSDSS